MADEQPLQSLRPERNSEKLFQRTIFESLLVQNFNLKRQSAPLPSEHEETQEETASRHSYATTRESDIPGIRMGTAAEKEIDGTDASSEDSV